MGGYKKEPTIFRRYNVPELMPLLMIFLSKERHKELSVTKFEFLVLICVDVLTFLEGYATMARIMEITGATEHKMKLTMKKLFLRRMITNISPNKFYDKMRLKVGEKGKSVFSSYSNKQHVYVHRLKELGINFDRLR